MALLTPPLALVLLLLLAPAPPAFALPIVDPGLFVIMGVKTCRTGSGYCILGNNCTLDKDFLPDDRGGHCNGLRSAFTPSAEFICCRYSAEPVTTETSGTNNTTENPTTVALVSSDNLNAAESDFGLNSLATIMAGTSPAATSDALPTDTVTESTAMDTFDTTEPHDAMMRVRQTTNAFVEDLSTTEGVDLQKTTTPVEEISTVMLEETTKTENDPVTENEENVKLGEGGGLIRNYLVKRTRVDLPDAETKESNRFMVTVSEITSLDRTEKPSEIEMEYVSKISNQQSDSTSEHSTNDEGDNTNKATEIGSEENKNSVYSFTNNGIMMHDILKLITEGEWQISFKNNEVSDGADDEITTDANVDESYTTTSFPGNENDAVSNFSDSIDASTENPLETRNAQSDQTEATTDRNYRDSVTTQQDDTQTTEVNQSTNGENPSHQADINVEKEIIVKNDGKDVVNISSTTISAITPEEEIGSVDEATSAEKNSTKPEKEPINNNLCIGEGKDKGDCWLVRFIDTRFDNFICHGTLIDGGSVVTSAVCAISIYQAGTNNVRARGESSDSLTLPIRSIAVHEDFRPREIASTRYDVGLVTVAEELKTEVLCTLCMADPQAKPNSSNCYTFTGASQGNGAVTKHVCRNISSHQQEDGNYSLICSLSERDDKQIHSGAPLVCGGALAGVAHASQEGAAFTPASQLLPWVRWNLQQTAT